jgi:hypothetical protein
MTTSETRLRKSGPRKRRRASPAYFEESKSIFLEITSQHAIAEVQWEMGLLHEQQGDLSRAAELMQVYVDYLREIGHTDAEKRAEQLAGVRGRMEAQSAERRAGEQSQSPGAVAWFFGKLFKGKQRG